MHRRRTPRAATQAQAIVALAVLPLALTASDVGLSATDVHQSRPMHAAAFVERLASEGLGAVSGPSAQPEVPAAFRVPERPTLGSQRAADIPWPALRAYQRAAQILGEVSPSCSLRWTLLGAIGQVESGHGTARGGELGDDGMLTPALRSRPLDGTGARPAVTDTDRGRIDGDRRWDRAVGPMQLLPGLWSLVRVDGDGDGKRSVQDVDDAALAAGVYLCATGADLSDPGGLAGALREYNAAPAYAGRVLAVQRRYERRGFAVSGVPAPTTIAATLAAGPHGPARQSETALKRAERRHRPVVAVAARRPVPTPPPLPARHLAPATGPTTASTTASTTGPTTGSTTGPTTEPTVPTGAPTVSTTGPTTGPTTGHPVSPTDAETPGGRDPGAPEVTEVTEDVPGPRPVREPSPATGPGTAPATSPETSPATTPETAEDSADPTTTSAAGQSGNTPGEHAPEPAGQPPEKPAGQSSEKAADQPPEEATGPSPEQPGDRSPSGAGEERTRTATGVLTVCGQDLCLDATVLDLSGIGDLAAVATSDLDGDGTLTTLGEELAGLTGKTVELLVVTGSDPLLVLAVEGSPHASE